MRVQLLSMLAPPNLKRPASMDLIALQCNTRCTDDRDRLYSILGLLKDGRAFAVNYEEDSADLFWRAGEHFQIWHHSRFDTVRTTLRLSENDLRISLNRKPDLRLTLPIHYAYRQQSRSLRLRREIKCGHENCSIPCMPQHEVVLCTSEDEIQTSSHMRSHVLLRRDTVSGCDISFAIATRWRKRSWNIEIQDALLQTSPACSFDTETGPVFEEASINQRCRENPLKQYRWATITQWDQLTEMLETQNSDKLSGHWRLNLPAEWILRQLESMMLPAYLRPNIPA
jgi:hypothetical protein